MSNKLTPLQQLYCELDVKATPFYQLLKKRGMIKPKKGGRNGKNRRAENNLATGKHKDN